MLILKLLPLWIAKIIHLLTLKSPSEHNKLNRLNDLGEPSLKNLEGTTRLEGKYKVSETSKSTESKYTENTFNDIPKHDALIRKAFENPYNGLKKLDKKMEYCVSEIS